MEKLEAGYNKENLLTCLYYIDALYVLRDFSKQDLPTILSYIDYEYDDGIKEKYLKNRRMFNKTTKDKLKPYFEIKTEEEVYKDFLNSDDKDFLAVFEKSGKEILVHEYELNETKENKKSTK